MSRVLLVLLGGGVLVAAALSSKQPPLEETWQEGGYVVIVSGTRWMIQMSDRPGVAVASGESDDPKRDVRSWLDANGGAPDGVPRYGLRVDGCDVYVEAFEDWLSFAVPLIPSPSSEFEAEDLWVKLFEAAVPECPRIDSIRGDDLSTVFRRFEDIVFKYKRGEILSVQDPAVSVAARAVGMSAPKPKNAKAFIVARTEAVWTVVVDPHEAGGWRWRVWEGLRQGAPAFEGHGVSMQDADSRARKWIGAYGGV